MNVMDMFLQNISLIAVEKIDEIAKEKNVSSQGFLKVNLKRRGLLRKIKDYDKGRKEKSQNGSTRFFARNIGAHSTEKGMQHKKWNVKKSKSLEAKESSLFILGT
jgi:hypothetical protein